MLTGWNFHELYLWHDTGRAANYFPPSLTVEPGEHVEHADVKRRFRNLVEVSGLLARLIPIASMQIDESDLAMFHDRSYVERIKLLSADRGGDASVLTPFGPGSYDIARLAVGGIAALIRDVMAGEVNNGYALVRPPGHHAEREQGMGFCLFANVPIAVMKARSCGTLGRVAIVDWDVHHGNGTQQAFYSDPDTLVVSVHQEGLYPLDTGTIGERGEGAGLGYNINVPLPAGSGEGAYLFAFERVVLPALRRFSPDLIIVCSGFDASCADPLGRMMLNSDTYRSMTYMLMQMAKELCDGRLVMSHEGGYSASYVPYCGLAVLEALSGVKTAIDDPFLVSFKAYAGNKMAVHQEAAVLAAARSANL